MLRGLYTAGSAMMVNNKRIDVVSNNLANIDTVGFKKDEVLTESFENVLIQKRNGSRPNLEHSRTGFTSENRGDFHYLDAPNAFFRLEGNTENDYSHSVALHIDDEGFLSTFYNDGNDNIYPDKGNRLYGQNGLIQVGEGPVDFDDNGNVLVNGNVVENILHVPGINVLGAMSSGVRVERTETLFEQGQLERTDYAYDLAIDGKGFFEIESPLGTLYTRDGRFKIDEFGFLNTAEGFEVVGLDGPIEIFDDNVQINSFGEVIVDGVTVDKISVVNIENSFDLEKYGGGYFRMAEGVEVDAGELEATVRQGYIEKSNANNLIEMIQLMELYRNYESNQRMVVAYDQTLDKAVNQIGRL
jgi:flagellar basal-body rod protein FlgG